MAAAYVKFPYEHKAKIPGGAPHKYLPKTSGPKMTNVYYQLPRPYSILWIRCADTVPCPGAAAVRQRRAAERQLAEAAAQADARRKGRRRRAAPPRRYGAWRRPRSKMLADTRIGPAAMSVLRGAGGTPRPPPPGVPLWAPGHRTQQHTVTGAAKAAAVVAAVAAARAQTALALSLQDFHLRRFAYTYIHF